MIIDDEILERLVPFYDLPDDGSEVDYEESNAQQRIRKWSNFVRTELRNNLNGLGSKSRVGGRDLRWLKKEIDRCLYVGIGIFKSSVTDKEEKDDFPSYMGYQFGITIFYPSGSFDDEETTRLPRFEFERLGQSVPVNKQAATFNLNCVLDDACSSVMVEMSNNDCLLTAGHAVANHRIGQSVRGSCAPYHLSCSFQVKKKMVGKIDAALVTCHCGIPCNFRNSGRTYETQHTQTQLPTQGTKIRMHFGYSGKTQKSTIVMALFSSSQILTSVAAREFLTVDAGIPGDSGSLVATDHRVGVSDLRLVGMYLGDCDAENPDGTTATYGYAIELDQAVKVLRGNITGGIFNV